MIPCLLCPAVAVQDALCVPCGAKLWAAESWTKNEENARRYQNAVKAMEAALINVTHTERTKAILTHIRTPLEAHMFLVDYHAAMAEHGKNCGRKR